MSISESIEVFLLDARTRGLRPASLVHYERMLRPFTHWAAANDVVDLDQVDTPIMRQFVLHCQSRGLRPTSIRSLGRVLRAWLNFAKREGLIGESPMQLVRLPKSPRPAPDCFTHAEIGRLLQAAEESEDPTRETAIVLCLLDTGLRVKEFTELQRGDLDIATGAIAIRSAVAKTGTPRIVFLGATARAALVDYLATLPPMAAADPLWHGRQGPLTVDGLKTLVQRLGQRAGVHPAGPHKYRRTFATYALRSGMDPKTAAAILGHSVDELLKSYVYSDDDALKASHALHGPVDKLLK